MNQPHYDQHRSLTLSLTSSLTLNSLVLFIIFFLLLTMQPLMPIDLVLVIKEKLIFSFPLLEAFAQEINTLMRQFVLRKTLYSHTDLNQDIQQILIK